MAFWRNVDCWIFVPDQGRLPLLDCKEGFRISRWPHSCLEKALPAWAEAHELLNPFICHSQRAGWDERKRGPGFLVGFSKPDHHAFTRLHSTQIPERKCCMKSMLSLVTIYHDGKIQMFQCLSLQFEWEFHNQSHKETNYTNHFILAPFGFSPTISAQIDPHLKCPGCQGPSNSLRRIMSQCKKRIEPWQLVCKGWAVFGLPAIWPTCPPDAGGAGAEEHFTFLYFPSSSACMNVVTIF